MGNNPDYDACIAVPGNTPAMCAATFGGPGDDTEKTLDDYIGLAFLNPATAAEGILEKFQVPGGQPAYYLDYPGKAGAGKVGGQRLLPGSLVIDPRTRQSLTIGTGRMFTAQKLSDSDMERIFGVSYTGAAAAPAWSGTRGAWQEQSAWQAEQDRRDREAAAEEAEKTRQNQRRLQIMGDLRSLAQTAASVRQQYRSDLMGLEQTMNVLLGETLGEDVVKGAIMSTGQVQRGVTPMQAHRTRVGELGQAAGAQAAQLGPLPAPNLGADIAGLEAQMPQYEEWQQPPDLPQLPTASPYTGLAEGGTMFGPSGAIEGDVLAVDGVPVGTKGTSKVAVLVGEGRWDGDEEVVIQDRATGETEIVPLAGGAAGGASLPYDPSTIGQALAPMYAHLGLGDMPTYRGGRKGIGITPAVPTTGGGRISDITVLRQLGVQPQLVRFGDNTVFFVDPTDPARTLHPLESAQQFGELGFDWGQVVNINPARRGQFGPAGAVLSSGMLQGFESEMATRRFPAPAAPIAAPFSLEEGGRGFLMPAMRTIASIWNDLSPAVRDVITSAFGVANITPETMEAEREFFTPSGTARAPRAAMLA